MKDYTAMIETSFSDFPRLRRGQVPFLVYTRERSDDGLVDPAPYIAISSGNTAYDNVRDTVLNNPDIRDYSIAPLSRRDYAELRWQNGDNNMMSAVMASVALHNY